MKYRITAPGKKYERKIAGVQFIAGEAETENEWAAQWFSGRDGFAVECLPETAEKEKPEAAEKKAKAGK